MLPTPGRTEFIPFLADELVTLRMEFCSCQKLPAALRLAFKLILAAERTREGAVCKWCQLGQRPPAPPTPDRP